MLNIVLLVVFVVSVGATNPPHIVLIVADDMGWNDVSWNNADIQTPNLEGLANQGVILNSSYVMPVCSPTRSSLFTGRYAYHLGLQHGVIQKEKQQFLTTNYTTLPEKLKEGGYSTHMVGKWHLGYCDLSYTPTHRGFDSYGGILLGSGTQFDHTTGKGFDFRQNENVSHTFDGIHSTDAYTELAVDVINNHNASNPLFLYVAYQAAHSPLETNSSYDNLYTDVANEERRNFSRMVTHLDDSVGEIYDALDNNGLLDNLVLVFLSDNGGDHTVGGNNYPLRGKKGTLWEGGVRTPAFVYSNTNLIVKGYTQSEMIHVVDWYPTFLDLAGVSYSDGIDGVNQWNMISNNSASNRTEFVYNINKHDNSYAIRVGDYKLTQGKVGVDNDWFDVPTSKRRRRGVMTDVEKEEGRFERAPGTYRLFNIANDPNESTDLSDNETTILESMKTKLENYKLSEYPANVPADDTAARPRNFGGVWSPGWCTGDL